MSKKIAFLFPGQGAQYPGMGRDFYETFAVAQEVFTQADALLNEPFSQLIFHGPSEQLVQTQISQLAIFIMSMALLRVIESECPELQPTVCAGLSLGEYSALVAAGKLDFEEALFLVKARGKFMQEACKTHPGSMQVILGLELPTVQKMIDTMDGVWIANLNCPGQIVIAGTNKGIEKALPLLKAEGAKRILPLDVSGAFHSGLMLDAQQKLEPQITKVNLRSSSTQIIMNASGNFVDSIEEMRKMMVQQITHPVYWQKTIETLVEEGIELFIEIGPGKTLSGINKRMGVLFPTVSVEKVEDIKGVTHAPVA